LAVGKAVGKKQLAVGKEIVGIRQVQEFSENIEHTWLEVSGI
jgi:hypothetical protein